MTTSTRSPKMTRSDIHRPSLLDPAEYKFICAFYQGDSEAMHDAYEHEHKEYNLWIRGR